MFCYSLDSKVYKSPWQILHQHSSGTTTKTFLIVLSHRNTGGRVLSVYFLISPLLQWCLWDASSLIDRLVHLGMSGIQTVFLIQNHMNYAVLEVNCWCFIYKNEFSNLNWKFCVIKMICCFIWFCSFFK